ncbi:DNA polymerase III subunit delta [Patescibacteria group bacterium]|nr:DNA polymerase III subunit delta [Patescibacteria group bacterium]MBU1922316.1 DNA polymerase III subunit delta [Patescibacteria group bacterium]
MIIWLYGENTYDSRQKLKQLVNKFKQKFDIGGLNLIYFKEKWEIDELYQAATSAPFLAPKKMVIVENISKHIKESNADTMAGFWAKIPAETILVLWEQEEKVLDKLFKAMPKKEIFYYKFPLLTPSEVKAWLRQKAREKDTEIDLSAQGLLLEKVGYDLWRLDSELEKLKARAGQGKILSEHVNELVDTRLEDNVFIFCNFLVQRKPVQALAALEQLIEADFSETELLNKLVWQLKVLLKLKSYADANPALDPGLAAKELGLHPFVVRKASPLLKDFKLSELRETYKKTLELDNNIKLGRISPRLGLEIIVSQF